MTEAIESARTTAGVSVSLVRAGKAQRGRRPAGSPREARPRDRHAATWPGRRSPVIDAYRSYVSDEATELMDEEMRTHGGRENAGDDQPAQARWGGARARKRPKISFDGVVAGARFAAQIAVPTSRKSRNWPMTRTPEPIKRDSRVTQRAGGEEPLHDQLVGAVGCRRKQCPADKTADEGIRGSERKRWVEDPQLPCRRGKVHGLPESTSQRGGDPQGSKSADEVDHQLDHVGPDHRLDAPDVGVPQGDDAHDDDRRWNAPPGEQGERNRAGKNPHAVTEEARHQEDQRYRASRRRTESRFEPCIGGFLLAAEVARQQPDRDPDAAEEIADRELQKGQVATRPDGRGRDDRDGRGLSGDDRQQHRSTPAGCGPRGNSRWRSAATARTRDRGPGSRRSRR